MIIEIDLWKWALMNSLDDQMMPDLNGSSFRRFAIMVMNVKNSNGTDLKL